MDVEKLTVVFSAISGVLMAKLGSPVPFYCLCSLIAIDYVLGLMCAFCGRSDKSESGKLSSKAMAAGIFKKLALLLGVALGITLDYLTNAGCLGTMVIISICASESLSIIENLCNLGIRVPKGIVHVVDALDDKDKDKDEDVK